MIFGQEAMTSNRRHLERDEGRESGLFYVKTVRQATYPANKQAKEEVACVGLNRSLEQALQHVGVHYPAER
ncbi:hypothetical protein TNCV_238691 [Trichonephila clavipes]|nr:hypothetical protein TNCV_238691 [Trichonephila clavipes]